MVIIYLYGHVHFWEYYVTIVLSNFASCNYCIAIAIAQKFDTINSIGECRTYEALMSKILINLLHTDIKVLVGKTLMNC